MKHSIVLLSLFGTATLLIVACSSGDGSGSSSGSSGTSGTPGSSGSSGSGKPGSSGTPGTPSPSATPTTSTPSGKDLGEICTKDADCAANLCVFKGNSPRGICTKLCKSVTDCPGGFVNWEDCGEVQNVTGMVCIPKT